jgi:hypothetical protein
MAVVVKVVIPGLTREQYDALRDEVGWLDRAPDGGLFHMAWWEGDVCNGADAWESEEAFAAFGAERLAPALEKLGITADVMPTFYSAHEVYAPSAATILAT